MFAKLTRPPKANLIVAIDPSGSEFFHSLRVENFGDPLSVKFYSVIREQPEFGTDEVFSILGGDNDYTCLVTDDGLHSCTCPNFEYMASADGRPCRHLHALIESGLMTKHKPEFYAKGKNNVSNETTSAA